MDASLLAPRKIHPSGRRVHQPRPAPVPGPGAFAALAVAGFVGLAVQSHLALADEGLSDARRATILARVLSYDRNLPKRAGTSVNLAILGRPRGDQGESRACVDAFRALERLTINKLPLRVTSFTYAGRASLEAALRDQKISVLYLGPGLEKDLDDIISVTRALGVMSMGSEASYLERGVSIGVFRDGEKNTVWINLKATRAEGISFSSDLLQLAKLIDG